MNGTSRECSLTGPGSAPRMARSPLKAATSAPLLVSQLKRQRPCWLSRLTPQYGHYSQLCRCSMNGVRLLNVSPQSSHMHLTSAFSSSSPPMPAPPAPKGPASSSAMSSVGDGAREDEAEVDTSDRARLSASGTGEEATWAGVADTLGFLGTPRGMGVCACVAVPDGEEEKLSIRAREGTPGMLYCIVPVGCIPTSIPTDSWSRQRSDRYSACSFLRSTTESHHHECSFLWLYGERERDVDVDVDGDGDGDVDGVGVHIQANRSQQRRAKA